MQRLAVLVLWCLLALIPLRGWAHGQMLVNPAATQAAAVSLPHCHDAAAEADGIATPAQDDAIEGGSHGACSLCAVCHAAGLPIDFPLGISAGVATHVLQAHPSPGLCKAWPRGVFRPPRPV